MTEGERETLDYTTLNMFAVYLGIQVLLFTGRVTHGQYLHTYTTPLFLMKRSTTLFSSHREKTRRKKKDHVIRVTRENFLLFFSFLFFLLQKVKKKFESFETFRATFVDLCY